jgi:hypothetical protein
VFGQGPPGRTSYLGADPRKLNDQGPRMLGDRDDDRRHRLRRQYYQSYQVIERSLIGLDGGP